MAPHRVGTPSWIGWVSLALFAVCSPVISLVRLLEAPVVGNVLPLGVHPVEGLVHGLGGVVPVLPDDAVGSLQELV